MNKQRRKLIAEAVSLIEQAKEIINQVYSEEQEAYDNMPESLQCAERGEQMSEYIYTLETAETDLDDMIANLSEITES